ncbi:hypothetical protein TH53_13535 [Pedobacter lusitanus]|uniref:Uncharacterized protein n=1 Tax=Pedobacter lusitanus TaxID=1503925 RepID=A0A0D0F507_9SPHI|nr:DUF6266 family protein [Pedobacter lusitanus]KIO76693.1 hypothetical protein TH53_13535 [Pedobacter lusitanus]
MATFSGGLNDGFRGRVGNTVTYMLNGKLVKRTIGLRTDKPTVPVLQSRQVTALITAFLKPVKEFITIGFELAGRVNLKNYYNIASSYNRVNAISGIYPEQQIDFAKVLFSQGQMPLTPNVFVSRTENGLTFNWDVNFTAAGIKGNDQVMLMAYDPKRRGTVFQLNAGRRNEGIAHLSMRKRKKPLLLETYISFISENRKCVSNSIYTGQVIW